MSTTELAARVHHGVTLEQYAVIRAGIQDGLSLPELLAFAGVALKTWPRAEDAWGDRLLADLDEDGPLADALDELMRRAQRRWLRRIPPLDTDLRSWLDFERTWALEVDGEAFLAGFRMRPSDMTRLGTLWADRLQADPALASQALAVLAEEPGPLCAPNPEPARLQVPGRMGP